MRSKTVLSEWVKLGSPAIYAAAVAGTPAPYGHGTPIEKGLMPWNRNFDTFTRAASEM